ncbi:MAG: hypothetical protein IJX40_06760 [Alistipes sp.]|nr:hypothetical protein [Alistipes sp.]MBQ8367420.1 hypothetical protein [Alistipes sp.]
MKNIKFLFLAVATLCAGAFTACQEDWNPGPVDSDLSVYMPTDLDVVAFAVEDNPDTEIDETRVATYPLYRQNPGPEMVVEIRSRMVDADLAFTLNDEDGKPTGEVVPMTEAFVFAESVTFAEGETVAYLNVTLDERLVGRVAVGTLFGAEIMIKDSQHYGSYGLYRKNVEVGIPETWVTAHIKYDPKSDEKFSSEGYLYDDFVSFLYSSTPGSVASVTIEQSEARPGVYRLVNPYNEESVVSFIGGIPVDMTFPSEDTYILIDARNPEKVYIDFQFAGMTVEGWGDVYILSTDYASMEDGIISFPEKSLAITMPDGMGYLCNTSGKMRIVLPGIDISDYSFGVTYIGSESAPDNSGTNAVISFTVGADVSRFGFVAVKGNKEIKTVGISGVKYNPGIVDLQNFIKYVDEGGKPEEYDYSVCDADTIGENMSLAKPNERTWSLSFDEANVYTIFAIPYDKDGNALIDGIVSTYFYYRPANSADAVPDIKEYTIELDVPNVVSGVKTDVAENVFVDTDLLYSPSFTLHCDINYANIDEVSALRGYFAKKADIDAKLADGKTYESLTTGEGADDLNYFIDYIKQGRGIMNFGGLEPDTEYSMILAVTSIYGKTIYIRDDAKTDQYNGPAKLGIYEFEDGDSKMQIKVAPYFLPQYAENYYIDEITDDCDGQAYLLTFVGDTLKPEEDAEDQTPIELKFYGLYLPEFDAIVVHGPALGYESYRLFGVGLDTYIDGTEEGDPEKLWGYYSSSTSDYEYSSEAMVLYLNEEGTVVELATYFKKYYYWYEDVPTGEKDKNGKDITEEKYFEETLTEFTPNTTITLIEDHTPVVTPDDDTTTDDPTTDDPTTDDPTTDDPTTDDTQTTAKRASVGVYNGTVKCELRANTNGAKTAVVSIQ